MSDKEIIPQEDSTAVFVQVSCRECGRDLRVYSTREAMERDNMGNCAFTYVAKIDGEAVEPE